MSPSCCCRWAAEVVKRRKKRKKGRKRKGREERRKGRVRVKEEVRSGSMIVDEGRGRCMYHSSKLARLLFSTICIQY
jgi:hypothetical protein